MATTLNAATVAGGKVIKTDTVAGAEFQIVKINVGDAGNDSLLSSANPLPVTGTVEIGGDVSLTGSVAATLTGPVSLTGSFLDATSNAIRVSIVAATQPVSGTLSITGSMSVLVSSLPAVSLTGSFMDTVNNALKVNVVAGSAGGPSIADDTAFSIGAGGGNVTPVGGVFDDTTPDSVDEGDAGIFRMSARRELYVQVRDAAGNERGLNIDASNRLLVNGLISLTGSIAVTPTGPVSLTGSFLDAVSNAIRVSIVAATQPVSGTVSLGAGTQVIGAVSLVAGTAVIGSVSLTGSYIDNTSNSIRVSIVGSAAIALAAGTANIGTVSLSGSTSAIIQGAAAHGAAVAGNPVLAGREARTTFPTAVTDGQAVRAMADDAGRTVIVTHAPRDLVSDVLVSLSVSTTSTLVPQGAANVFHDILTLILSNNTAADATIQIFDATTLTAMTQRMTIMLAANGGGAVIPFATPLKQAAAQSYWGIKTTGAGGITGIVQYALNR